MGRPRAARAVFPAVLLGMLLSMLPAVAFADYELPDEGLPQMQPTGLEAVPDEAAIDPSIVEMIAEATEAQAMYELPRMAQREDWSGLQVQQKVRALDDPENCWAAQYTDYDRWLFEHFFPYHRERHIYDELKTRLLSINDAQESDWVYVNVEVDKAGFMLPSAQSWERRRPQLPAGSIAEILGDKRPLSFSYEVLWTMPCAGVMPADMRARMEHDRALQLAADFPPVPQWLGLNPCAWVVFLPGGELLCSGGPGSYADLQRSSSDPADFKPAFQDSWQRFSFTGEKREPLPPQERELTGALPYFQLLPGMGTYTTNSANSSNPEEYDIVTDLFRVRVRSEIDPASGSRQRVPLFATDLLGVPLDLDAPLEPAIRSCYRPVDGDFVRWLYQAQLELGLTSGDPGPEGC